MRLVQVRHANGQSIHILLTVSVKVDCAGHGFLHFHLYNGQPASHNEQLVRDIHLIQCARHA